MVCIVCPRVLQVIFSRLLYGPALGTNWVTRFEYSIWSAGESTGGVQLAYGTVPEWRMSGCNTFLLLSAANDALICEKDEGMFFLRDGIIIL